MAQIVIRRFPLKQAIYYVKPLTLQGLQTALIMKPNAEKIVMSKRQSNLIIHFKRLFEIAVMVTIIIRSVNCAEENALNGQHLNFVVFHVGIRLLLLILQYVFCYNEIKTFPLFDIIHHYINKEVLTVITLTESSV